MSRRQALLREAPAPIPPPLVRRQADTDHDKDSVDGMNKQQLLLAKAWNFVAGSSGVFLFPYINLYLAQRGLSSAQIGLLAALRTWIAAPLSLAATAASDRYKVHKQLLLLACIASCGLRSSLPLVSGPGLLFAALLLSDLLGAPVNVLADATVLSNCNEAAGESYGKQRQWGSIGFGLSSLPAGWLIGQTGLTCCFLVYGLASLPLIAVTSLMQYNYRGATAAVAAAAGSEIPTNGATQQKPQQKQKQSTAEAGGQGMQQQQMSGLLRQPAVLLFLWRCLLLGLGMGVMANYEFLWLKQLGAPETLMGFAIAVSVTTEVPAFMLQGAVLKRVSPEALLNMALAATALRLSLYGLLPLAGNPWAVLPVELLHGITFGLGWGAATASSTRLAPPHLTATMQGLFQSTYAGVGAGLGGLIGGLLMESQGGQGLFFTAAAVVAVGGLAGAVVSQLPALAQRSLKHKEC